MNYNDMLHPAMLRASSTAEITRAIEWEYDAYRELVRLAENDYAHNTGHTDVGHAALRRAFVRLIMINMWHDYLRSIVRSAVA